MAKAINKDGVGKNKTSDDTKNYYGTPKRAMRKTTSDEKFQLGVDSVKAGKFYKNTPEFEKKYPKNTRVMFTPTSFSKDTTTGRKYNAVDVKPYPKKTTPTTPIKKAPVKTTASTKKTLVKIIAPIKKTAPKKPITSTKPIEAPKQKKIVRGRENYSSGKLISKEYQDSTGKWIKQK